MNKARAVTGDREYTQRRPSMSPLIAGCLLFIATAAVTSAQAQEIDSIIVTAERRNMPSEDVPIAMSALVDDTLSAAGITDIRGLARRLSSLDVKSNAGPTTTSSRIRRVGNIGNTPTFGPAVAVLVNGVFRSRRFLSASDLFGVERIDVLWCQPTASYGKDASAALIALHTRQATEALTITGSVTGG